MIKNTSTKKQKMIAAISALLLAAVIVVAVLVPAEKPAPAEPSPAPEITEQPLEGFAQILDEAGRQLALQDETDAQMLEELDSGNYSFESPLVVTDPYGLSPLTALVLFKSEEPLNISIHIEGKDALTDIDFTFDGYSNRHIIPVYGLYPDTQNRVTLTAKDGKGVSETSVLHIQTEPLPDNLAKNIILTDMVDEDRYQPGLNFCFEKKAAFDANGEYRWALREDYLNATLYDYNGHFIIAAGGNITGDVLFYETNPLGRIYRLLYAPYGLHHDMAAYKDGYILAAGSQENDAIEDFIYEVNVKTGEIEHTLDLKTVFQRLRYRFAGFSEEDWFHLNAITWAQDLDGIIISGRHQSVVAQISWPEGEIGWMLSPPEGWLPMFQKHLLTPTGDTEFSYEQHAPEILPDYDNNPDTIDLLVFDNGNQRFGTAADGESGQAAAPELYSRMVHYRINIKEMTFEQIWEYGKEEGEALYSESRGGAELLENGNFLGFFPVQRDSRVAAGNYLEVDADGQVVWEALGVTTGSLCVYIDYRVHRMDIYSASANDLQLGVPAKDLVPDEVYERLNVEKNDEQG